MQDVELAARFEAQRPQLRALAYRMLGVMTEADDALQETWVRLQRADVTAVENLGGWLTTVTSRICLNLLRTRQHRAEEPLEAHLPDPWVTGYAEGDPEADVLLDEQVGMALMVVLDQLAPAERVAFVLHDVFGMPFEAVADLLGRAPAAARQLASRARRRIRQAAPTPDAGAGAQRAVVEAFFAASRAGDLDRLVAVLDPHVVLRVDAGREASATVGGADAVAARARSFAGDQTVVPVLVNGAAGAAVVHAGHLRSVMAFTVRRGRVLRIDALSDPARLAALDVPALDGLLDRAGTPW